jgi:hypothetical protein
MVEAHIKRSVGEISLSEFQEAIRSIQTLEESGEHFIIDEVIGEPIYKNGKGIVYLVGERNCIGYIEHQDEELYVRNVPNSICSILGDKLSASVIPIYYHGQK